MAQILTSNTFYTASFGCATTLLLSGLQKQDFEIRNGSRVFYRFYDYDNAKLRADDYWLDLINCSPMKLFEQAEVLKYRLVKELSK